MGAGESNVCRTGQHAGNSGKNGCCGLESEMCRQAGELETQAGFVLWFMRQDSFIGGNRSAGS